MRAARKTHSPPGKAEAASIAQHDNNVMHSGASACPDPCWSERVPDKNMSNKLVISSLPSPSIHAFARGDGGVMSSKLK